MTAATDLDLDDLDIHPDEADPDNYRRISAADLKRLRKAADERRDLRTQVAGLNREKQVRTAGLEGLSERRISVLAKEAGDDATPEDLRELAVELGFIEPAAKSAEEVEQEQIDSEAQAHGEVAAASVGGTTPRTGIATAKDYGTWGADKRMRFQEQHPALAEAMLRDPEAPIQMPNGFA